MKEGEEGKGEATRLEYAQSVVSRRVDKVLCPKDRGVVSVVSCYASASLRPETRIKRKVDIQMEG